MDAVRVEGWTTAQAAYMLEEEPGAFTKAVDKTPVTPTRIERAGAKTRVFLLPDLVYLHGRLELSAFAPGTRAEIYGVLKGADFSNLKGADPGLRGFKVRRHLIHIRKRIKELSRIEETVDALKSPPVVRGTEIEAYRIAALLDGGMTVAEVLGDYPLLTKDKILAAKSFAEANPKRGRPFPGRTAKAAMRSVDLSGLDAYMDARE